MPFTNRVKARLGAFDVFSYCSSTDADDSSIFAPQVRVTGEWPAVEGEAKDAEIADVLVRLEALGIVIFALPDEADIVIDNLPQSLVLA